MHLWPYGAKKPALNFENIMVLDIFHKIKYSVPDSDEGSEIEDIAFGSESEDHWEELSHMDMDEEVESEGEGEPDEVDMSVWEYIGTCVLQWYVEGNLVLQSKGRSIPFK